MLKGVIIKIVCKKEVIGLTVTIKEVAEKAGVSVVGVLAGEKCPRGGVCFSYISAT